MTKIKILIVDDHPIIRDGLRTMLEAQSGEFEYVVFEAENEAEALKVVHSESLDCVIMDFQLKDKKGHEITKEILAIKPELHVLGLSNYDEYAYALDMLKAGAKGYILKNVEISDLVSAIHKILDGQVYYSSEIANKLINYKLKELVQEEEESKKLQQTKSNHLPLSKRELQIIKLIANEYTNEEIAQQLELSKRTVDNHRQNVLNKLQLRNTAGLVKFAYMHQLI